VAPSRSMMDCFTNSTSSGRQRSSPMLLRRSRTSARSRRPCPLHPGTREKINLVYQRNQILKARIENLPATSIDPNPRRPLKRCGRIEGKIHPCYRPLSACETPSTADHYLWFEALQQLFEIHRIGGRHLQAWAHRPQATSYHVAVDPVIFLHGDQYAHTLQPR
jgi:hypothetical protein